MSENKIIIESIAFDYNEGLQVLKRKYQECPFKEIQDVWEDIEPADLQTILKMQNLEARALTLKLIGIEEVFKNIPYKVLSKETVSKQTTWVTEKGELETVDFEDTYQLLEINTNALSLNLGKLYMVKCKDTSTDRVYLIWVTKRAGGYYTNEGYKYSALQAIAWTIQTTVPEGNIKRIIRQGDCILVEKKDPDISDERARSITKEEYLEFLKSES